jgi:tRNA 2-selenouridine synthase
MTKEIMIKDALVLNGAVLIDVRSEGEFAEATIPGAINIPLLRDAERADVGTTYKHKGVDEARALGLEYVSPRLPIMINEYRELSRSGIPIVFCWRGGMRSKAVCSTLDLVGITAIRLIGGYKAYRKYVNDYFNKSLPHKGVVLHGLTGVGKTEVLLALNEISIQAIDLEGLANNRGSVFGQIGMGQQPSQKMFEGLLANELVRAETAGYFIVECESRRIGRIIIPLTLINAMKYGIRILAYCSLEERIKRIKRIYSDETGQRREELIEAIVSLSQRLGRKKVDEFTSMLGSGLLDDVVEYLLVNYYDPLYRYPLEPSDDYDLCVDTSDIYRATLEIQRFMENTEK